MDKTALVQRFLDDAASFIDRLNNTLLHLEKDPGNLNLVHQAFRFVHSIKSEASYLQMDAVTKSSHNMETLLDIIRKEKRGISRDDMRNLYECADELQELFSHLSSRPDEGEERVEQEVAFVPETPGVGVPVIGELEKALLTEARERGEKLYRLTCDIEESAAMKKSRVFLLINNLELIVNVITVEPSLEEEQDELFRSTTVIFSSDIGEKAVRDAVHVDQVRRVQIVQLNYDSLLASQPPSDGERDGTPVQREGFYRIPSGTLDEVFEYMDQIKLGILRMSDGATHGAGEEGTQTAEISGIRSLTARLETLLKDIRKVRLSAYFSRFGRLVRDLAEDLHKKVELEMDFGDLALDRNSAELLSEVLVHIIRNAVDHGIEPVEERIEAGKPEYGTLEIRGEIEDGCIRVTVGDDGRGIDEVRIREQAAGENLPVDPETADLIDILSAPGFSTRKEATDYSGRGVGLDVIAGKLEKTRGGNLEVQSSVGDGTTFTVTVPLAYNPVGILLVRSGEETLALPLKNLAGRFAVDADLFGSDEKGFLTYDGEPVFGTDGRIFSGEAKPEEKFGLFIQHLGSRGVLLVDELLIEKEIPDDSLDLGREIRPHIFSLGTGQGDPGYLFVNPSIISKDL